MLSSMPEIGTSIRSHFSHVPKTTPIYLFMDNAGGHGKTEVKAKYEKYSKINQNIIHGLILVSFNPQITLHFIYSQIAKKFEKKGKCRGKKSGE